MHKEYLLHVLSGAIIGGLVIGGGVYAYSRQSEAKNNEALQAQIDTLKTQLAVSTPTPSVSPTTSPSATTSPTATPQSNSSSSSTYSSTKYNFSFSYPKSWNLKETAYKGANLIINLNEKPPVDGTDKPADLSITVIEYVKPLDSPNMYDSLEAWLKEQLGTSGTNKYQDVTAVTIGGRSGFVAKAGVNEFGGGTYYFVGQKDKSVIQIHDFKTNGVTRSIIDTLKFAQ